MQLKDSEINHLRRLLGWVACEIGQSPEELIETMKKIAPSISHDVSEEAKARLVDAHQKASNVPKYVRAAVKALRKGLKPHLGDIVDAEFCDDKKLAAPITSLEHRHATQA